MSMRTWRRRQPRMMPLRLAWHSLPCLSTAPLSVLTTLLSILTTPLSILRGCLAHFVTLLCVRIFVSQARFKLARVNQQLKEVRTPCISPPHYHHHHTRKRRRRRTNPGLPGVPCEADAPAW